VLISVAVSTSTTDAGAAGVAEQLSDVCLLLERREVRELERRRLGVLERLFFEEDLLLLRLALLEAFDVLERLLLRRLFRFELLGVRARRLLLVERRRDREVEALVEAERDRLRLGAFGVLARRAERRRFELERRDVEAREEERRLDPSAARRLFELFGVRARRLLLFERRRDREVEALIEEERDLLRLGAFGVLARRAERRRLEPERDVDAEREDDRRLDPFGVRALREELRRAFLRF